MPSMNLTNDEREVILKLREADRLVMGHCEDFPACGHTPDDPCARQWYDHPDAFNPAVNPHCFCDHEIGCDVDDDYDDEGDDDDVS